MNRDYLPRDPHWRTSRQWHPAPGGIDLTLYGSPGRFALGRITGFGSEREIKTTQNERETIRIRFTTADQVASPVLRTFLEEYLATNRTSNTPGKPDG